MTKNIEQFLVEGCNRCEFGGTPKCKVLNWLPEIQALREVVLGTGLKEEMKWGSPVYTKNGKNIVMISALKESANLSFFKGTLLKDPHRLLQQQGNIQAGRIIKFTKLDEILKISDWLADYVQEAIFIEDSGQKVEIIKNPEPIPDELLQAFEEDPGFENAFNALTLGRQRGYIIHFSQPKQSETRTSRINKLKKQVFDGIGLNDKYSKKT